MRVDQINPRDLVVAIRAAFPKEAQCIDQTLTRDGYEGISPHTWVEHFSQHTTNAIDRAEFDIAAKHLTLLSQLLLRANEETARCIDVAYVESLMWDIKDEKRKAQGWKLIPDNLRALYLSIWGERPFMKGMR